MDELGGDEEEGSIDELDSGEGSIVWLDFGEGSKVGDNSTLGESADELSKNRSTLGLVKKEVEFEKNVLKDDSDEKSVCFQKTTWCDTWNLLEIGS